ncbi:MAG: protein-ADP-ribose hydrolase [Clostridium perfringens]|nr:protein-ADP-ribose hydrolase [Clostridium perfringens]
MNREEKIDYLINRLVEEDRRYETIEIPKTYEDKFNLLRSLMNVREPKKVDKEFIKVQDNFLKEASVEKGIVDVDNLETIDTLLKETKNKHKDKIILWQGDITTLKVDAIVNAANSQMLGCFVPCHKCIDNVIHTFSGIQLRNECNDIMEKQGCLERTGSAKITKAYNLPCKHVIHTVGPIISNVLTSKKCLELKSCYESCLNLAKENNLKSIAFCCISTGEFHFPNEEAAKIAIDSVCEFLDNNHEIKKVIFNVFKGEDYRIYENLLR